MTSPTYYRGRDTGREVIFDFPTIVQTRQKADLESHFAAALSEKENSKEPNSIAKIEIQFLRDTLARIRAGRPLVTVTYQNKPD